jgi:type IV fimbrial biogenesis protein FimT
MKQGWGGDAMIASVKKQRGLSLIELVGTISIIAVINVLAAPTLTESMRRNQLQSEADRMLTALYLARSEAVKRNQPVSVCRSSDGASCTGNWEDGWIVFSNADSDNSVDSGVDEVIRSYESLPEGHGIEGSVGTDALTYFADGSYADGSETIRICSAEGQLSDGFTLSINRVGRPRASKGVASCGS